MMILKPGGRLVGRGLVGHTALFVGILIAVEVGYTELVAGHGGQCLVYLNLEKTIEERCKKNEGCLQKSCEPPHCVFGGVSCG